MDSSPELDKYGRPYPPKTGNYYIPQVAADAICVRKEGAEMEILLITRGHEPQVGSLAFPGGHIDYNEAPAVAAVRELEEECGIKGSEPELVTVRGEGDRDKRKHMITIVYQVKVDPDTEVTAGDDAATANWYPITKLLSEKPDFAFDHLSILEEYLEKFQTGIF